MSRLTDLIAKTKLKDPDLGRELEKEFKLLAGRRSFGLNFERHTPESVELPGRPIRKGDKVRVLPPRGSTDKGDKRLWKVVGTSKTGGARVAQIDLIGANEPEMQTVAVEDLIVVAEFRDYIYPGLVSTGKVTRGGDKPFHTVINGENFHALEALTYTHRGKIDVIYIDPPYNTGAKDWKYNNDYVEGDDLYRHSKWLAFMERRLKLAKKIAGPKKFVLDRYYRRKRIPSTWASAGTNILGSERPNDFECNKSKRRSKRVIIWENGRIPLLCDNWLSSRWVCFSGNRVENCAR